MKTRTLNLIFLAFAFTMIVLPMANTEAKTEELEWTRIEYTDDIILGYSPFELSIYNTGMNFETGTNETLILYITYYEVRFDSGTGYETIAYKVFSPEEYIAPNGYLRISLTFNEDMFNMSSSEADIPLKIIIKNNMGRLIANDIYNIKIKILTPIGTGEFLILALGCLALPIYAILSVAYYSFIKDRKMDTVSFMRLFLTLPYTIIVDYINRERSVSSTEYLYIVKRKMRGVIRNEKAIKRQNSKMINILRICFSVFYTLFTTVTTAYFIAYPIMDTRMTALLLSYLMYSILYALFINRFLQLSIFKLLRNLLVSLIFIVILGGCFYVYCVMVIKVHTFEEISLALRIFLPSIF